MFCSKCGKQLREDAMYCSYCGEKVRDIKDENQNRCLNITEHPTRDENFLNEEIKPASSEFVVKKILQKIYNGAVIVVSFFIFALAATIGKMIVHDGMASRVASYLLPGLVSGCAASVLLYIIFINKRENISMAKKIMIWVFPIGVGVLFGIYGSLACGCICSIVLKITQKNK